MDGFPETQGKILTNSSKFFENSSKILSKLKQNPQKLNLPEIPFTCVAAKTAKKQACPNGSSFYLTTEQADFFTGML